MLAHSALNHSPCISAASMRQWAPPQPAFLRGVFLPRWKSSKVWGTGAAEKYLPGTPITLLMIALNATFHPQDILWALSTKLGVHLRSSLFGEKGGGVRDSRDIILPLWKPRRKRGILVGVGNTARLHCTTGTLPSRPASPSPPPSLPAWDKPQICHYCLVACNALLNAAFLNLPPSITLFPGFWGRAAYRWVFCTPASLMVNLLTDLDFFPSILNSL